MKSGVTGHRGRLSGALAALVILLASIVAGMTPVEIKRDYGDAVVTITTYSAAEDAVGLGSGFIVDPSGVIVTCYHVIDGAYPAVVKLLNGASFQEIWVLGCDSAKDVAVIKVKGRDLPTVKLGRSDEAEVGERVVAIGNPKGLENTVSDGLLSGIREMDSFSLLQISAPISPGSSGGPVFNSQGQVIGIAAATLKDGQNLNFCVPIGHVIPFLSAKPVLTLEDFSQGAGMQPPAALPVQAQGTLKDTLDSHKLPESLFLTINVRGFGTLKIQLYTREAPKNVANVVNLAITGFYNGLTFHRLIPGFIIQGGDPSGNGTGGPGYTVPAEIKRRHERGSMAMARTGDQVNPERRSSGSQFYICFQPAPQLDGQYTVIGQLVQGMDVLDKLEKVPTGGMDKPVNPVVMERVFVTIQ